MTKKVVKLLSSVGFTVESSWCRLCGSGFKNFRKKGNFKKYSFLGGRGGSSFVIFGLFDGLCELQMLPPPKRTCQVVCFG